MAFLNMEYIRNKLANVGNATADYAKYKMANLRNGTKVDWDNLVPNNYYIIYGYYGYDTDNQNRVVCNFRGKYSPDIHPNAEANWVVPEDDRYDYNTKLYFTNVTRIGEQCTGNLNHIIHSSFDYNYDKGWFNSAFDAFYNDLANNTLRQKDDDLNTQNRAVEYAYGSGEFGPNILGIAQQGLKKIRDEKLDEKDFNNRYDTIAVESYKANNNWDTKYGGKSKKSKKYKKSRKSKKSRKTRKSRK